MSAVRAVLTDAGMANGDALTFAEADLTRDAGVGGRAQPTATSCCMWPSPVHTENVSRTRTM